MENMDKLDGDSFDSVFNAFFGPKTEEEKKQYAKAVEDAKQDMADKEERRKESRQRMDSALTGLGMSAALIGGLAGGMGTMFGMNSGHEFREYVHAVIDGFMSYLEVEREENKRLKDKLETTKEELDAKKAQYDSMCSKVDEMNAQIVELTAQLNIIAAEQLKKEKANQERIKKAWKTRKQKKK